MGPQSLRKIPHLELACRDSEWLLETEERTPWLSLAILSRLTDTIVMCSHVQAMSSSTQDCDDLINLPPSLARLSSTFLVGQFL